LPGSGSTSLAVYDSSGSRVATLAAGPRTAGACETDRPTGQASAGVYVIRLEQNGHAAGVKVMITE
jgi:hypothetical protein